MYYFNINVNCFYIKQIVHKILDILLLLIVNRQENLTRITPLIFLGESKWTYSSLFEDLVDNSILDNKYIPKFEHELLDHSGINKNAIKGSTKARIVQLLFLSKFQGKIHELTETLIEHLSDLEIDVPGINYFHIFIFYIAATHEKEVAAMIYKRVKIKCEKKQKTISGGDHMLTAIESWKLEGEKKGEMKGEISVIEKLIQNGIDWSVIKKAIGIDPQGFQELKMKYQKLISQPSSINI